MQFESQSELAHESQFFLQKPVLRLLIIGFLFITAFGIRLYHINQPPLDFHPIRQYHSANIARGYYFETLESIPEWRKQVAAINKQRQITYEPRILERAASFGYRIFGGEYLWIPRTLSSAFWVIGGVFLYLIAVKIMSGGAALFSTVFYLFLPYGISASRSFQPDPLMIMMLLVSLFLILRYFETLSIFRLLIAAAISALAILIKPMCIFLIFGTFVSLGIYKQGIRRSVISNNFLIFTVVSFLPAFAYYVYVVMTRHIMLNDPIIALQSLPKYSFRPHLILSLSFWKVWLTMIGRVVGYIPLIGAILGFLMFKKGLSRTLLIGLCIGYFIYGLVFTHHMVTHDYYQLQLIPVVALSLGPIGALIINRLTTQIRNRWRIAVFVILLPAIVFSISFNTFLPEWRHVTPDVKSKLKILGSVVGVNPQFIKFISPDFEREVRIAKEIGEIVGHNTNTVILSSDSLGDSSGRYMSYHGEFAVLSCPIEIALQIQKVWGRRVLKAGERFKISVGRYEYTPDYFIVTDFREFEKLNDLKVFLTSNFPIVVQNEEYLIFDLRKAKQAV